MSSSDKLVCKKCSNDRGFIKSDRIVVYFPLLDNKSLIQDTRLAFMLRISDALIPHPLLIVLLHFGLHLTLYDSIKRFGTILLVS